MPTDETHPDRGGRDASGDLVGFRTVDGDNYSLGGEVARGGMGRIVSARDLRIGRPVAVKELLSKQPAAIARFEREARITGRLQHPAIVPLYEAGKWADGEPFYAMKMVEGRALDAVIADTSTLGERLALLPNIIAVADALAYAHSHRIIHRDLKPANVLLGEFGETVVIDWGLAKDLDADPASELATASAPDAGHEEAGPGPSSDQATMSVAVDEVPSDDALSADRNGLTVEGRAMGTPAYMPPEQAQGGAVDQRADVYALGAMLYHALAGQVPYADSKSAAEVLEKVVEHPPEPLAGLQPDAPPDLIAIVEKAMARDPEARYATARELAEDLRRFETGQLVGVHEYTLWELVRRWTRRHAAVVTVVTIAALVLAVVGAVSVQRIRRERAEAQRQRELAEAKRVEVEDLLDFMLLDLRKKLEPTGRLDLLGLVAQKSSDYYQRQSAAGETPSAAWRRSVALRNIGDVLRSQGDLAAALEQYSAARAISERLAEREPGNSEWRSGWSRDRRNVGAVLREQGDLAGALAEFRAALDLSEQVAREHPDAADLQRDLSAAHLLVGEVRQAQGELSEALEHYRASLAIRKPLAEAAPDDAERQRELAIAMEKVGDIHLVQGALSEALAQYRKALAMRERLVARDANNLLWLWELAASHETIGKTLLRAGEAAAGLDHFRKGLAIREQLTATDASNTYWQRGVAISHQSIGDVLLAQAQYDQALTHYLASLEICRRLADLDPSSANWQRDLAASLHRVGNALRKQGALDDALSRYCDGLAIREKLAARDPANAQWQHDLAGSHESIGLLLRMQVDLDGALDSFRASLAIRERLVDREPTVAAWRRLLAKNHIAVAEALRMQGDVNGSLAEGEKALVILERAVADFPLVASMRTDLGGYYYELASAHAERGDAEIARGLFGKCGESFASVGTTADDFHVGACCFARRGDSERAFELLENAVARGLGDAEMLEQDEDLASLRGSRRWRALLREVRGSRR